MSKASEWADGYGKRPTFGLTHAVSGNALIVAQVSAKGEMDILPEDSEMSTVVSHFHGFSMKPAHALKFADWIRKTFGD